MPATTTAASGGGVETTSLGKEAIRKLKSTDPPLYLSPTPDLSESARLASEYLFSSLKPYAHKSPFSHLLVKGFDAEQIWQQIDIQSQPLISSLRRKVQNFEKNPEEIKSLFNALKNEKPIEEKAKDLGVNGEIEDFEDEDLTAFGDEDNEDDDDEDDDDEEEEEEEEDEDEEEKLLEKSEERGIEDKFLKINELEDYLEADEAKEYGLKREKKKGKKRGHDKIAEGDEEEHEGAQGGEDDEDDEDEDGDELGLMGLDDDDDDEDDEGENARYNDFFVGNKGKTTQKRKNKSVRVSDNLEMDEESKDDDNNQKNAKPSTHERELERRRSTIEEMEKANIEPKSWTMLGEVTAAKRPKNSALGVDIDFEQNAKPAPVTTIEYDGSLEDMITKRATERGYDDIEKPPTLPSRAPREVKELDENKSKKGLGDIYEEEYAEKTGLVSVAVSLSEQQKKEAKLLFKELCLKLDALSHFHFTPKPVIEDMSIQTNVPAFAMEEIAPVAVSDAAMLAPEEVFAGKGDIKDETELTQAERKRRRANKKRKFKANEAKKVVKTQPTPQSNIDENDS